MDAAFGAWVKDRRRQLELSLRELSSWAGTTNPELSQIERGLAEPSDDLRKRLVAVLRENST